MMAGQAAMAVRMPRTIAFVSCRVVVWAGFGRRGEVCSSLGGKGDDLFQ